MKWIAKIFSEKEFHLTALRFYLVGLILFIIPYTRDIFLWVTPWVLLANLFIILYFHKQRNLLSWVAFFTVMILSILLEMMGTADPRIFGSYHYLSTFGIKVKETPLLIGVNWLMLVYGSHALASHYLRKPLARILLASLLMICYDLIIEGVAPVFRMWEFDQPYPPLQNFIMWFIAAFIFLSFFEILKVNTDNRHARILFLIQLGFFGSISVYLLFFAQ